MESSGPGDQAGKQMTRGVGIVGYGSLGQYLVNMIIQAGDEQGLRLVFVWNRSQEKMAGQVPEELQLRNLDMFGERNADLIIEVSHPQITREFGERFLRHADFMAGSPTAFADPETETRCRGASARHGHTLYIPRGALWGGPDIQRMADRGSLKGLKVTMTKAPGCFRLEGALRELNLAVREGRTVLYEGSVRSLCPQAPNNVNTMAAAAMAAHNLGFDLVQGCLVSDPQLGDWHVVDIEVTGPGDERSGQVFTVKSSRRNPAAPGAVTGKATYGAFWSSVLSCTGHGGIVFLC